MPYLSVLCYKIKYRKLYRIKAPGKNAGGFFKSVKKEIPFFKSAYNEPPSSQYAVLYSLFRYFLFRRQIVSRTGLNRLRFSAGNRVPDPSGRFFWFMNVMKMMICLIHLNQAEKGKGRREEERYEVFHLSQRRIMI